MRWFRKQTQPVASAPVALNFAEAERLFLQRRKVGQTSTGALVIANGGSFHVPRPGELAYWMRDHLIAHRMSHLWSDHIVSDFAAFLQAGADVVQPGVLITR
jgi:hypothetical protein